MFGHDVHVALAWATGVALIAVAVEAAVRSVAGRPPGGQARAGLNLVLVLLGMTAAAGLAMLVASERPKESLHLLYAVLAFGLIPVADSLMVRGSARGRALARLAGSALALGIVARLFATG